MCRFYSLLNCKGTINAGRAEESHVRVLQFAKPYDSPKRKDTRTGRRTNAQCSKRWPFRRRRLEWPQHWERALLRRPDRHHLLATPPPKPHRVNGQPQGVPHNFGHVPSFNGMRSLCCFTCLLLRCRRKGTVQAHGIEGIRTVAL